MSSLSELIVSPQSIDAMFVFLSPTTSPGSAIHEETTGGGEEENNDTQTVQARHKEKEREKEKREREGQRLDIVVRGQTKH